MSSMDLGSYLGVDILLSYEFRKRIIGSGYATPYIGILELGWLGTIRDSKSFGHSLLDQSVPV